MTSLLPYSACTVKNAVSPGEQYFHVSMVTNTVTTDTGKYCSPGPVQLHHIFYSVESLYKGQRSSGLSTAWTRCMALYKGSEPLYKGHIASLQGTSWRWVLCPLYCPVEPLYKGQVEDGPFFPYTVEPLYKGQVEDRSFVPCTVEPLYKGHIGDRSFVPCTVKPLYKGQVMERSFVQTLYKGYLSLALFQR